VLLVYSIMATIACVSVMIYLLWGFSQIKRLSNQPLTATQPSLAIIIPVRNEEEDLEIALQSVCNINYDNYRIIVVNDRSTDHTPEILDNFAKRYPKITVTTITELPYGWLGKNNALYEGYKSSTEEWLLFTDADIAYHPDAINKAMGYVLKNNLDNLAVLPGAISRSAILNSVLATFSVMLMAYLRPWDAIKPNSGAHIGVGAFCLVKRTAYEKAGTHVRVKLRPDDDVKLGYNIKKAGLRQDVLSGIGTLSLEWYKNLGQFVNGLMKNSFATANYNFFLALGYLLACLICLALPIPLMLIFGDTTIRLMAIGVLLMQILYMIVVVPNKWWYALMIPFSGFLMAYIFARSTFITLKQGGIYWRDSFYSLAMLRGEEE
jgi:glycosyltransferase involved in cell wall biosynthesis